MKGPTVPADLQDKWWRVEAIEGGHVKLSKPFLDSACTLPYHPPMPTREDYERWRNHEDYARWRKH